MKCKKYMPLQILVITIVLFLFSSAYAAGNPSILVSLDLNNGPYNPNWIIDDPGEVTRIQELLEGLPESLPKKLSLYEFAANANDDAKNQGLPDTFFVEGRNIEVPQPNGTSRVFQDTKGLREFILSTGVKRNVAGIPREWIGDPDYDYVLANQDACPNSNDDPIIRMGACNSGVSNQLLAKGCTITDKIAICAKSALNHDQFVSCVAQLTNNLKKNGKISSSDKSKIQTCAAQADIP